MANPLTLARGASRGGAVQTLPGMSVPVRTAQAQNVMRDVTPPKTYYGSGSNRQILKGDYDYVDAARLSDESKQRIAGLINSEDKVAKMRKALVATGAVSGSVVAGLGVLDLLNIWEAFPPAERVEAAANIAQEIPESAETIKEANNLLADANRLQPLSYNRDLFGETHIASDNSVASQFSDLLDPQKNEEVQMLDSTYALARAGKTYARLCAEKFVYNNLTAADIQVLEDRYNAKFK